ncbi:hypothetical protein ACA758_00155 [Mycoplasmopsis agassizii]|uniref:Uncharacterized protein n=1 Tax=Mycoplasmopsis agassizii TaxID=33922 RepID=A0ABX4H4K6_9BACT|nr:hypothetical protein [Mycoplasmopsis agassizii]PAF54828.1 hypothetical protein CJF60_03780 [Mycoplasmopsis agassizii]SMC18655.1 hypothetical protein SAMN02745179_00740 [Mycoplasmopsis agassizii]
MHILFAAVIWYFKMVFYALAFLAGFAWAILKGIWFLLAELTYIIKEARYVEKYSYWELESEDVKYLFDNDFVEYSKY